MAWHWFPEVGHSALSRDAQIWEAIVLAVKAKAGVISCDKRQRHNPSVFILGPSCGQTVAVCRQETHASFWSKSTDVNVYAGFEAIHLIEIDERVAQQINDRRNGVAQLRRADALEIYGRLQIVIFRVVVDGMTAVLPAAQSGQDLACHRARPLALDA